MPAYSKRARSQLSVLRRRPLSTVQVFSHVATFYCIGCFAGLVVPAWCSGGADTWGPVLVAIFWFVFVADLSLYGWILNVDCRYVEALPGMPDSYSGSESRQCDDCGTHVSHTRVKHCQSCGWCMEGFDHHCRYLNVCVGGRSYPAWFSFVALLFILMVTCSFAHFHLLSDPSSHDLHQSQPVVFYIFASVAGCISSMESLFLLALIAQHTYFCLVGITTLEYIKDQASAFPGLPPNGWREAVERGECFDCGGLLELVEAPDVNEVLYCSICQGDIAKAGVVCWQCDICDLCSVCPLCYRLASSTSTVITYRASALRRRSQAVMGALDLTRSRSQGGGSSCKTSWTPNGSTSGEQREHRAISRRTISAVVAAVEGHGGETKDAWTCCPCGRREEEAESESSTEEGDDAG
ncbi:zdhhc1 [Symbiodinium sp. CCMP2456]|nr:zdhhc1 [Symbiodinium sp. CCMP2456]